MSEPAKQKPLGQFLFKNVRFSYVHVDAPWKKKTDPIEKAKFGVAVLVPKNHPQLAAFKETLREVATAKWADAYTGKKMKPIMCLRDGSEKDHKEGYDDSIMFFNASRSPKDGAPAVRDTNGMPISPTLPNGAVNPAYPYSGAWGHVLVKAWAQDNSDGQRINCSLEAIIKVKDDKKFDGGNEINVDEALSEVCDGAPVSEDDDLGI